SARGGNRTNPGAVAQALTARWSSLPRPRPISASLDQREADFRSRQIPQNFPRRSADFRAPAFPPLLDSPRIRGGSVRIAALRETIPGERRVAITPESTRQLVAAGFEVVVQAGAGVEAGYQDAAYVDAGASVETDPEVGTLDALAHVRPVAP